MEERYLQFDQITKIKEISSQYTQLDNSYFFARVRPGFTPISGQMPGAVRFNGLMFILLRRGNLNIEVNLEKYSAGDNTLITMPPSTLFSFRAERTDNLDASIVFLNYDFLQEININPSAINLPPLTQKRSPVHYLTQEQSDLLSGYLDLFYRNSHVNTNHRLMSNIASNLISAIFYQLMQFMYNTAEMSTNKPTTRRSNYVNEFLKLVHVYYNRERSVQFYAKKLFISPKYLSMLVKEATGKSAARLIDEFVLLEAKNMLRFSGKNIQQVAYALNFSNQSSFGKYFKHLTGMSPSDFQKS